MNNPKKIKVALLFGGKSAEHEVSIMSARNVYQALDKNKYEVHLIGITKTGRWLPITRPILLDKSDTVLELSEPSKEISNIALTPASGSLVVSSSKSISIRNFDVVFPILHGPYGEDGSVQGLLKLTDIPYVGAGVLGSAVGMDKDVMKRLLREAGLPISKFIALQQHEKPAPFVRIKKELGLPIFIKPANLGSSVGISRVENAKQYKEALTEAFTYDSKVIIEECVNGREIECSVLGNEEPIASLPGEVVTDKIHHSFYSYNAKYLDEHGAELIIPSKLSKSQIKTVQKLAVTVFKTLCCEGMGRVDFFLRDDGSFIVNEINTIPGFTSVSMYPKLWKASGISYSKLVDKLISLAIERKEKQDGKR